MKKLLIAALSVVAASANAIILYEQGDVTLPDNLATEVGVLSDEFTDFPANSTYCFDNITSGAWNVEDVWIEGITLDPVLPVSNFHLRFSQNANFTGPGVIGLAFSTTDQATLAADKDLRFDLGTGMVLAPGTWFVSAWVMNTFGTSGQWTWKTTTTVVPGEAIAHNPGGATFGGITTPIPVSQGLGGGPPRDLVFRIEGTVIPEPGTFVAIGFGLVGLAIARRRK